MNTDNHPSNINQSTQQLAGCAAIENYETAMRQAGLKRIDNPTTHTNPQENRTTNKYLVPHPQSVTLSVECELDGKHQGTNESKT